VPFLINICNCFKFCPSLLESTGICVPTQNVIVIALLAAGFRRKTCPSARCASAANTVCKDNDIYLYFKVTINFDVNSLLRVRFILFGIII
jgi:hypothetical protein